jgi:hypothetical protein
MPSIRARQRFGALAVCAVCLTAGLAARQSAAPKPRQLTAADLKNLRWIEGSWRGTGGGVPPFFERYRFESPTMLIVESLEGEKVTSTSRYELKDGEFSTGSDAARAIATALDDKSITFEFVARQRGSFRWERVSPDSWKAVLNWPAANSRPAGERVYQLERRKQ